MSNILDPSLVEDLQPSSEKVDGDKLLNEIESYISEHVILPKRVSIAITLWCVASFSINIFRIFPKLVIHSPVKRCGKSTVLDLIEAFSSKSLLTSNATTASIFRIIDECQPTLIIDEADTFVAGGSKEMVGIINSGHAKNRAYVIRCDGDNNAPKKFSTWTPMVFASIKELQPTIMDRSIAFSLQRKGINEKTKRIHNELCELKKPFRQDILKWSMDNIESLKLNQVEPANRGNDRATDNWIPLFTIAKQAGEAWLEKCESAYIALTDFDSDLLPSEILLQDIKDIFNIHNSDKISSAELLSELNEIEDHPWCEWSSNRPMTKNALAIILKPFKIRPKAIRYKGKTPRGYELAQFKDAFNRYL